jgi:hypothetical protein
MAVFRVRVADLELAMWREAARARGLSVSEYVRRAVHLVADQDSALSRMRTQELLVDPGLESRIAERRAAVGPFVDLR